MFYGVSYETGDGRKRKEENHADSDFISGRREWGGFKKWDGGTFMGYAFICNGLGSDEYEYQYLKDWGVYNQHYVTWPYHFDVYSIGL